MLMELIEFILDEDKYLVVINNEIGKWNSIKRAHPFH